MIRNRNAASIPAHLKSYNSSVDSPLSKEMNYQVKAKLLFDKLNNVRDNIEDNKYNHHQKLSSEINALQEILKNNIHTKGQAFQKVLEQLGLIQTEIEEQKVEA